MANFSAPDADRGELMRYLAELPWAPDARASTENGNVVARPWIGRFSDYKELGGRRLPSRAEGGYVYDSSYSTYWRGEFTRYQVK